MVGGFCFIVCARALSRAGHGFYKAFINHCRQTQLFENTLLPRLPMWPSRNDQRNLGQSGLLGKVVHASLGSLARCMRRKEDILLDVPEARNLSEGAFLLERVKLYLLTAASVFGDLPGCPRRFKNGCRTERRGFDCCDKMSVWRRDPCRKSLQMIGQVSQSGLELCCVKDVGLFGRRRLSYRGSCVEILTSGWYRFMSQSYWRA